MKESVYILGVNAYHGDAAAAIIKDGELIAAVEEERFNRIKHCAGLPVESIRYCLQSAGIGIEAVDHVGISRDPAANLHKKVLFAATQAARQRISPQRITALAATGSFAEVIDLTADDHLPHAAAGKKNGAKDPEKPNGLFSQIKDRLHNAARVRDFKSDLAAALQVAESLIDARFHNIEHHRAHLASSFYLSPFDEAALLSIDGFGDFVSTMSAIGNENGIRVLDQIEYPHSAGIVYTATTQFLGFPHYGDEGKVMGLAPYGRPSFIEDFRHIIQTVDGGKFKLNLDYFRHHAEGVEMTWDQGSPAIGRIYSDAYEKTFGPPREHGDPLTDRDRDIAASLQLRLEEVAFHVLQHLHDQTGLTDLGLSGGVAYNSVMNGKILLNTPFTRVFVQPAAGDSGTALGVCYEIHHRVASRTFRHKRSANSLLYPGPEFSGPEIGAALEAHHLEFVTLSDDDLTKRAAEDIANGLVVGWFQGRIEFGPRALGNRSILADPRRAEMKEVLNQRIKKREPFRPFAPSILAEHTSEYFEQDHPAPSMLMVYQIKRERRNQIPAVTHIDGSGRLQTVSRADNPRYHQLITDFCSLTGVPIVLNTSFNENEPIVCSPGHAIDCFLKTRMDVLYLGNQMVRRPPHSRELNDAPSV